MDRLKALNLLNSVSDNIIPQRMWLTNIRIDKNRVNIQGLVIDNKTAVDFMKGLEKAGYFMSVHLKKLKRDEIYADLNFKMFEIYCSIKKNEKK
ncbi:MAG: PilN domain-containing protein [Deltaproteobacteria bacterium]|nr:PilN domain-containing protein [Deltaproteobacteria bacterium]